MPHKSTDALPLALTELVVHYFEQSSRFDSLSMQDATRISSSGFADTCTLVTALVYLERIRRSHPGFYESTSPQLLYVPALLLAAKYLKDTDAPDFRDNAEWASALGLETSRLNEHEWELFSRLDWDARVSPSEFHRLVESLEGALCARSLSRRPATYNELSLLAGHSLHSVRQMLHALALFVPLAAALYASTVFAIALVVPRLAGSLQPVPSTTHDNVSCVGALPAEHPSPLSAQSLQQPGSLLPEAVPPPDPATAWTALLSSLGAFNSADESLRANSTNPQDEHITTTTTDEDNNYRSPFFSDSIHHLRTPCLVG